MSSEVIELLGDIKVAIYWLLGVVSLGVAASWVRAVVGIASIVRKDREDLFTRDADILYGEGKFDQLLDHCAAQLSKRPFHAYALWYQAKAYFRKGEYSKAKEALETLDQSEPTWSASHVQPYLEKIRAVEKDGR